MPQGAGMTGERRAQAAFAIQAENAHMAGIENLLARQAQDNVLDVDGFTRAVAAAPIGIDVTAGTGAVMDGFRSTDTPEPRGFGAFKRDHRRIGGIIKRRLTAKEGCMRHFRLEFLCLIGYIELNPF